MPAFWDASGVVPLCVSEARTTLARRFLRSCGPPIVVWWATAAEVHSGIARLMREGRLDGQTEEAIRTRLTLLRRSWREMLPSDGVRDLAEQLLYQHPLRTADAFQLAAALQWCRERPRGRVFVCFDIRLADAAGQQGFEVLRAA